MYQDIYEEPLTIVIPSQLRKDPHLKYIDRSVWALIARFHDTSEDMSTRRIAAELDVGFEYVRTIKKKLAAFGYLTLHRDDTGVYRYLPIEPAMATAESQDLYLSRSKLFGDITVRQLRHVSKVSGKGPDKVLDAMDAVEATYEKNLSKAADPIAILLKVLSLKDGPTWPVGYERGWWRERIKDEQEQEDLKQAEEMERQTLKDEAERTKALDDRYNSLPVKEQRTLRKQAIQILKDNGGYLEHGRDMLIRNQIRTILEEKGGAKNKDGETYVTEESRGEL